MTDERRRETEATDPPVAAADAVPLVVDLDGTFLRADTLHRMALRLALRRPHRLPGAVRALTSGRAALKLYLWTHSGLDVARLRISGRLAEWLAGEAARGRPVHLATGAPEPLAAAVAREWPIFQGTLASTPGHNLTGSLKAAALVERFGEGRFDYVGNARADLPVWRRARRTIVCNAPPRVLAAARSHHPDAVEIRDAPRLRRRSRRSAGDEGLAGVRVVMVLYYYAPYVSGLTVYAQRLAEDLARRGARVEVVTTRHLPSLPRRETLAGVEVARARPLLRIDKGVVAPGLLVGALRRAWRADVVVPVLPLFEAGPLAALTPRRRLLPLYVCDLRLGPGALPRVIERLAASSARVAVSRAGAHGVLSHDYARASRIVADMVDRAREIPPPVDAWRYQRRPAGALAARLRLSGRPVVGFVGRIVFEKGLPVLVEAMRDVRRTHPDAVLAIAGDAEGVAGGGMLEALRAEIASDPGVVVTGPLGEEELLSFYSLCRVLALPSIDPLEAFGMVQVEAMLCGTPVVASDLPGVRLPVQATGMGLLAPPGDAAGLAAALRAVLDAPERFTVPRERVVDALDAGRAYDAMAQAVREVTR